MCWEEDLYGGPERGGDVKHPEVIEPVGGGVPPMEHNLGVTDGTGCGEIPG